MTDKFIPTGMTRKEAEAIIPRLGKASKMPCKTFNIPASLCKTGARLRKIKGSTCYGCYAFKGKWNYGKLKEEALESLSQIAIEHLSKLTELVIEEHVLLLSNIRRKKIALKNAKEVKHCSSQVDTLLKCIKGERTAFGLPNHFLGIFTYIPNW